MNKRQKKKWKKNLNHKVWQFTLEYFHTHIGEEWPGNDAFVEMFDSLRGETQKRFHCDLELKDAKEGAILFIIVPM